jgi:hypothetical protein
VVLAASAKSAIVSTVAMLDNVADGTVVSARRTFNSARLDMRVELAVLSPAAVPRVQFAGAAATNRVRARGCEHGCPPPCRCRMRGGRTKAGSPGHDVRAVHEVASPSKSWAAGEEGSPFTGDAA